MILTRQIVIEEQEEKCFKPNNGHWITFNWSYEDVLI